MRKRFLHSNSLITFVLLGLSFAAPVIGAPLFPNSVVSNNIDFIKPGDRDAFACLVYKGTSRQEMPHKARNGLFANGVHVFDARYKGGVTVPIWGHPKIGTKADVQDIVTEVAKAVGELPAFMLGRLNHVVVNDGNHAASGEDRGRFFVVYADNMRDRISTNDIQETVFHESVHATLDIPYARSKEWAAAQKADGDFITNYARDRRKREDLAETALFAWAMHIAPGRIGKDVEDEVRANVPNRLKFLEWMFNHPGFKGDMPARGSGC